MINVQIESKQRELLGVICLHDFYTDNICRDLEFEPTLETAAQLKNYALVFKPVPFGFLVLYNPEYSVDKLREMPKGMKLSFRIKNTNPNLMNFTEVPFWPEGVVFHYSNAKINKEEVPLEIPKDVYYYFRNIGIGEKNKNVLNQKKHGLLPVVSRKFNTSLYNGKDDTGVPYSSIKIMDERGSEKTPDGVSYHKRFRDANKELFRRHLDHEVMKLKAQGKSIDDIQRQLAEISDAVEKDLSSAKLTSHQIDLRHAPTGKYTLMWDGKNQEDVYISDNPGEKLFGMLDIFLEEGNDALLNRSAKDDAQFVQPKTFVIKFESRQTYWRYFFMNYSNSSVSPLSIRDENNGLTFTEPREGILEQLGTKTMISESLVPIALKDRPKHVLFLERMNGKRTMKEIRLPTPGPDLVKPVRVADESYKLYSDVFVYL